MERKLDHLALYSRKCKTCKHLDPEEKVAQTDCHFSKGNNDCPAKEVQLVVVGMARRFAETMKRAQSKSDIPKQVEILQAVEKRSLAFQHKFKEWLAKP
jgi:hypothetical protein